MSGNWLVAVTGPAALWAVNAAMLLVTFAQLRYVAAGRSARAREQRSRTLEKAADQLRSLPELSTLVVAWEGVLQDRRMEGDRLSTKRLVLAACEAGEVQVAALREVCTVIVNVLNGPAELIDEGLLRPKDLVREAVGLHARLLVALALVEPFVWFDSLVRGRGRWGYRPLQLREVLSRLRAVSPDPAVRNRIEVRLTGRSYAVEPSMSGIAVAARRIGYKLWSPTINVRTKLRQRERAAELTAELRGWSALPTAATDGRRAVDW